MSKQIDVQYFVAFSDRVVMTDDVKLLGLEHTDEVFTVCRPRRNVVFVGVIDEGTDALGAAGRWVGSYGVGGIFQAKFWADSRDREEGAPTDIVTFSPRAWRTVHSGHELVLKDAVESDAPNPTAAG